jgi:hypothetical protein
VALVTASFRGARIVGAPVASVLADHVLSIAARHCDEDDRDPSEGLRHPHDVSTLTMASTRASDHGGASSRRDHSSPDTQKFARWRTISLGHDEGIGSIGHYRMFGERRLASSAIRQGAHEIA